VSSFGFEVLTAMGVKCTVPWIVTPCSSARDIASFFEFFFDPEFEGNFFL
jgi:hypothetical protein